MHLIALLIVTFAFATNQQQPANRPKSRSDDLPKTGLYFVQPSSSRFFMPTGYEKPQFGPNSYPGLIGLSGLNSRSHVPGEGVFLRPPRRNTESTNFTNQPIISRNSSGYSPNQHSSSTINQNNSTSLASSSSRRASTYSTARKIGTGNPSNRVKNDKFTSNDKNFNNQNNTNDDQTCFPPLGCFKKFDFLDLLNKPIQFTPQSPQQVNATFLLFTKQNMFKPYPLQFNSTREEYLNSPLDPQRVTILIIHGWTQSFDPNAWMGEMKDVILREKPEKYNVIGVDWSNGAKKINYWQSVANTRIVGAATAFLLNQFAQIKGLRLSKVHIIGHSLGAQIAGFTGERLTNPQVGRITGLDPAGPAFYGDNRLMRLDKSDAAYVDILHTDGGDAVVEGFGLRDAVGDADFYPNGGSNQPNCGVTKGVDNVLKSNIIEGIETTAFCNHEQATQLMKINPQQLTENCQFVGYQCSNYDDFENGLCNDCGRNNQNCAVLSIWGKNDDFSGAKFVEQQMRDSISHKFYYKTNAQSPFCLHHYAIIVHLSPQSESATGKITLNLDGERRPADDIQLSENLKKFEANQSYPHLITRDKSIGKIKSASLKWNFGGLQFLNPLKLIQKPKIIINRVEVNYMSNINPEIRKSESSLLCPQADAEASNGETLQLIACPTEVQSTPAKSALERPSNESTEQPTSKMEPNQSSNQSVSLTPEETSPEMKKFGQDSNQKLGSAAANGHQWSPENGNNNHNNYGHNSHVNSAPHYRPQETNYGHNLYPNNGHNSHPISGNVNGQNAPHYRPQETNHGHNSYGNIQHPASHHQATNYGQNYNANTSNQPTSGSYYANENMNNHAHNSNVHHSTSSNNLPVHHQTHQNNYEHSRNGNHSGLNSNNYHNSKAQQNVHESNKMMQNSHNYPSHNNYPHNQPHNSHQFNRNSSNQTSNHQTDSVRPLQGSNYDNSSHANN